MTFLSGDVTTLPSASSWSMQLFSSATAVNRLRMVSPCCEGFTPHRSQKSWYTSETILPVWSLPAELALAT